VKKHKQLSNNFEYYICDQLLYHFSEQFEFQNWNTLRFQRTKEIENKLWDKAWRQTGYMLLDCIENNWYFL
jgi:hypothetical protein